uniref:ADAMTS-like protein 4 n=1 Tax=Styela clava TaxID=7725 RepID=UPI0019395AF7|nr:ADAMTS-like protein 4 [Styela clava]
MTSLIQSLIICVISIEFVVSSFDIDVIDLKVGCDNVVSSGLKFDKCGVCGGKEDTCKVIEDVFRRNNLILGYNFVTRLPSGAKRINITELSKSQNHLALNSSRPGGGSYININAIRGVLDESRTYPLPGTHVRYTRPFLTDEGEAMMIPGPIIEDLDVWLFYQGENPGISYKYTIDLPQDQIMKPTVPGNQVQQNYGQESVDQSLDVQARNTDLDGHATSDQSKDEKNVQIPQSPVIPRRNPTWSRRRRPYVRGNHPYTRYSPARNDYYRQHNELKLQRSSSEFERPAIVPTNPRREISTANLPHKTSKSPDRDNGGLNAGIQEGNNDVDSSENLKTETSFLWKSMGFGPCSKSCAEGRQTILIKCVTRETRNIVDDKYCNGLARPPFLVQRCNRQACPAYYNFGKWSECSRSCGVGRRSRRVSCRQLFYGNFSAPVSPKRCRKLRRPISHQQCAVQECPSWKIRSEWSKCNVECGIGRQTRDVFCTSGEGMALPRIQCARTIPPPSVQPCRLDPCVTGWFNTDWGQCSADCDTGAQKRDVICVNSANTLRGCQGQDKPNNTRGCTRPSCGEKYDWFAGTWGPCSVECGGGTQDRRVVCFVLSSDGQMRVSEDSDLCNAEDKPTVQQTCNTQRCGSRWYFREWNECSVTCGGGTKRRDVLCLDSGGKYSSLCKEVEKPVTQERCNTVDCSSFIDPTCVDKLKDCRMVRQARLCVYPHYRESCCHTCSRT